MNTLLYVVFTTEGGGSPVFAPEHTITSVSAKLLDGSSVNSIAPVEFLEWVGRRDADVVMVAHRCHYHRDLLLFALGSEGRDLSWRWYDTFEQAQLLFPWIGDRFWPVERPFSVPSLYNNLSGGGGEAGVDADVDALAVVFGEIMKVSPPDDTCYVDDVRSRKTLVCDVVPSLKGDQSRLICERLRRDLGPRYSPNVCTLNFVHLLVWAVGRVGADWGNIAREVEVMLREEPIGIINDGKLAEIIAILCGVSVAELGSVFPFCAGTPLAYAPLEIQSPAAAAIQADTKCGSMHSLYIRFQRIIEENARRAWLQRLVHLAPGTSMGDWVEAFNAFADPYRRKKRRGR